MAMVNPGVSVSANLLASESVYDAVTMPLFIGYSAFSNANGNIAAVSVASLAQAVTLFGHDGSVAWALRHFFENGGLCCRVLCLGKGDKNDADRLRALVKVLKTPLVEEAVTADTRSGVIVVPELSELNDLLRNDPGCMSDNELAELWYQGWQVTLQLCLSAHRRFALLEAPDEPNAATALLQRDFSSEQRRHGAAWWPRLQSSYVVTQEGTRDYRVISPLAAVAAVIQKNTATNGVWKAPANIALEKTLRPVRSHIVALNLMNTRGVNCNLIRSFTGKGVRLWGCRTLVNDENSCWRFIQTRLLVNSVEAWLSNLARTYLFEPNNPLTWMKMKGQIWTWLRQQWLAGAFLGTSEEDAFTVDIGLNVTMTEDDINRGVMSLRVKLALLVPAEFIDVDLTLDMRNGLVTTRPSGE